MTAQLRIARPGDEETLLEIQSAASLAALAHVFPPDKLRLSDEAIRDRWRRQLRRAEATTLLAEVDGRAAGLVSFSPAWLESLSSCPSTGAAAWPPTSTTRAIAELDRPCHLWVLEENRRARRFYDRRSWRPDGERRPAQFPPWPQELRYTLYSG